MMKPKTVGELMTPCPHSIRPKETLATAKIRMTDLGIHHLPVQEGGKLLGVISHRDLYFASAVDGKPLEDISIESVYSEEPYAVKKSTSLVEVCERMALDSLGCALVLDEEGKLVGIFTTTDACRSLAKLLKTAG